MGSGRRGLLAPAFFVACVAAHALFVVWLGHPWPSGPMSDENVYLELARNLWLDGTFRTKVTINYPPLYPAFVAPTFALASNVARFDTLHAAQAVLVALASLLLLPLLSAHLGRARAWVTLGLLQWLGGVTHYAKASQTEALFTALLVAAAGLAWAAWRRPSPLRWILLGALCGLAICTRRTALVLPVALGVLWLADAWTAWRAGEALPWKRAALMAAGVALGLLPELAATALSGEAVDTYSGNPAKGHLEAGLDAFESPARLWLAVQTAVRHVAYVVASTFGAPIVLVALLARRRGGAAAPVGLARAAGFVLLTSAGLVAMTTLHIIRFRYGHPGHPGWGLYPRYVDPPELATVAVGVAAAAWLTGPGALVSPRSRLRALLPLTALAAACALAAGTLTRPRGGRFPKPDRLDMLGVPDAVAPWALLLFCVGALAAFALWSWRGRPGGLGTVALAVLGSWVISSHVAVARLTVPPRDRTPAILKLQELTADPRAPLAVVVHRPGPLGRRYYAPAFRTDHPVDWIRPGAAEGAWLDQNPGGLLLVHRDDARRRPDPDRPRIARAGRWIALGPGDPSEPEPPRERSEPSEPEPPRERGEPAGP